MADLVINLLGQFQVKLNGERLSNFTFDKVRALLAYLAAETHCGHRREILANLFWPDKPENLARANLRNALADLRRVIGDHHAVPPFLSITRQDIRFNLGGNAWVDTGALTELYCLEKATPENIAQYHQILDIYQGEFLAGFSLPDSLPFDEWMLVEREHYAYQAIEILARASAYYEACHDYSNALLFTRRLLELQPWQEGARRQLMRLLAKTGRRDEALQQYQQLVKVLKTELDIAPEPKTVQLFDQIRSGAYPGAVQASSIEEKKIYTLPNFLKDISQAESYLPENFVSRQDEIQKLEAILASVLSGKGSVAFVAGEAGSGKSMLIQEFTRRMQLKYSALVAVTGFCNAYTGIGDPYLPFREVFYQLLGDVKNQWMVGSYSREYLLRLWRLLPLTFEALLVHGTDLIDMLVPGQSLLEFGAFLSESHPPLYQKLASLVKQKSEKFSSILAQASLFTQFGNVLKQIAQEQPLLIVLDDLQWADADTISLLFYLGKRLAGSKMMIIGAYRPEEVSFLAADRRHPLSPVLSEFKRDFGDVFIDLDHSEGKKFLDELLASEPNDLSIDFRETLYQHTEGHPLFTVEVLLALKEIGVLAKDSQGRWVTRSRIQIDQIPPKVEGIIAERINRLPQNLQRILTLASIEGEIFTAEIIAAVEKIPINQVVQILSNQLDRQCHLVSAQQIKDMGKNRVSTYRFRHILFQKYLYHRLDDIELAWHHELVGKQMEALVGKHNEVYAIYLAHHFHKANLPDRAVDYYHMAGERASRMSGYMEAISHFETALGLLDSLPENTSNGQKELSIQLKLGLAYQTTMGFAYKKAGLAFQRAWDLCRVVGRENSQIFETLFLLFSYYSNLANFEKSAQTMDLMQSFYCEIGEKLSYVELLQHWAQGYQDFNSGKLNSAYANFEHASQLYNLDQHLDLSRSVGMEAGIYCHGWAALHAIWLGHLDQARHHMQQIFELSEHNIGVQFTSDALWWSAWTHLEIGDIAAAKKYVQQGLEITRKEHYYLIESLFLLFKGRILTREGNPEEGLSDIQRAIEMFRAVGTVVGETTWLYGLAEAYLAAGKIDEGISTVEKIQKIGGDVGEHRHTSSALRIRGNLYLLAGDLATAEQAYLQATQAAREQSARLLELEAVKQLAHLWYLQGKGQQARQMLQEAYDCFTEGFDTPMLVEARELLAELHD